MHPSTTSRSTHLDLVDIDGPGLFTELCTFGPEGTGTSTSDDEGLVFKDISYELEGDL
jgi:hypothetical protein